MEFYLMYIAKTKKTASGSVNITTTPQTVCSLTCGQNQNSARILVQFDIETIVSGTTVHEIVVELWCDDTKIGQSVYTGTCAGGLGTKDSYFFEVFHNVYAPDLLFVRVAGVFNNYAKITANLAIEFDDEKAIVQRTYGSASSALALTTTPQTIFNMTAQKAGLYRVVIGISLAQLAPQLSLYVKIGSGGILASDSRIVNMSSDNDYTFLSLVELLNLTAGQVVPVTGYYSVIEVGGSATVMGYHYILEYVGR